MDKQTKDIFFAAYLIDENHQVKDFIKEGRILHFIFEIEDKEWKNLKVKYSSSIYATVNSNILKLKEMGR